MREYKLLIDLPFLSKNTIFLFNDENGDIFYKKNKSDFWSEYPLRAGLSGYLWMLLTEKKYLRKIK